MLNSCYAKKLLESITPDDTVLVYFDPDVDGLVAGKMLCDYLIKHNIPFSTYMNENRKHGFLLDPVRLKGQVVLSADFRVSSDELDQLHASGVRFLSLDHHENDIAEPVRFDEKGNVQCCVINVMFPNEPRRDRDWFLSGAGVVRDVLEYCEDGWDTDEYLALVGITLLTDVRPFEMPGANRFLEALFERTDDLAYFRYLIGEVYKQQKDYGFGRQHFTRNFVDFKFAPMINAMLRFNKNQAAIDLIMQRPYSVSAYVQEQRDFMVVALDTVKLFKSPEVVVAVWDEVSTRGRSVLYRQCWPNFLGLLAGRICRDEHKPCLAVYVDEGRVVRTSFRAPSVHPYRETIEKVTGVPCLGHSTAFGIDLLKVEPEFLEGLRTACKEAESLDTDSPVDVKVRRVSDLSDFVSSGRAAQVAKKNQYLPNHLKTYIQYEGPSKLEIDRPRYQVYRAGMKIVALGSDRSPDTHLIEPVWDRGVGLYLSDYKKPVPSFTL